MDDTAQNDDRGEIRYQRLLEEAPEIVVVLGPDLVVRYANPAIGRILGLDPRRVAGNPFPTYLHPEDGTWVQKVCSEPGCGAGRSPRELRVRHADGSWRWFEAVAADLLDDPNVRGVAVYLHDVTGGRRLRQQLAHRAFHDPLTGLPNRALFEDRLKHALARSERDRGSIAILFADLDDFKAINDGFGHEVGDKLLIAVGQRLEDALRPGDTVARLGGDEFALLLGDGDGALGAHRTMERIARALRQPFVVDGRTVLVTSSVGGALGESGTDGVEDLLRKADAAMYRAKRTGKGHFELFDREVPRDIRGRIWSAHGLRGVLENGGLEVHFLREADLGSGRTVSMERLLRWRHPWWVSPAEIIALAEMSGLIGAVGRRMLEEVCWQGFFWQRRYPEDPPLVSVNLSEKQLGAPGLMYDVAAALRSLGLVPANPALEIGEGFWVEHAPYVASMVKKCCPLGVRVVVEHFGQDRCSLPYPGWFPIGVSRSDALRSVRLGASPGLLLFRVDRGQCGDRAVEARHRRVGETEGG